MLFIYYQSFLANIIVKLLIYFSGTLLNYVR